MTDNPVSGDCGILVAFPRRRRSLEPHHPWAKGSAGGGGGGSPVSARRRAMSSRGTPSMEALETRYSGRVLMASALGDGSNAVTPAALVAAIKKRAASSPPRWAPRSCAPLHDPWLSFSTPEQCTSVAADGFSSPLFWARLIALASLVLCSELVSCVLLVE